MNPIQIIAGIVAGAVGAAVWAAIAYYANVEIGYIAWGIGILVGVAVAAAGKNSPLAGVTAVLITVVSIIGGKYAAVELAVHEMQAQIDNMAAESIGPDVEVTDEALQAFLAGKIAQQREANGEEIAWPEVAEDELSAAASFPEDIWIDAGQQLNENTDVEKAALREEHIESVKQWAENIGAAFADAAREEGFIASFSMYDVLFFGLERSNKTDICTAGNLG